MKFTCNTQPLKDALDLCVIRANISNFYKKSCIIQLNIKDTGLILNTEADSVYTEIQLKGSVEADTYGDTVFVSSLLLQQLVSTFESNAVTLEITADGLLLRSGASKFTLPKLVDGSELSLTSPTYIAESDSFESSIDSSSWKFVEDNQMYALSMSFNYPVYTKIWVGKTDAAEPTSTGDETSALNPPDNNNSGSTSVIVGDYDRGVFTLSTRNINLGTTCLLTDTIISLFTSLPTGAKLRYSPSRRKFTIQVTTDAFEYLSEFIPTFESDEGVGSYNSSVLLDALTHGDAYITVNTAEITKLLGQASLLSGSSEDLVSWEIAEDCLVLQDPHVNGKFKLTSLGTVDTYKCKFRLELLSKVLSKYSGDTVNISPRYVTEEGSSPDLVGIVIWDTDLTTVITCVDEG